jgi:hypothetical protein
MPQSQRLKRLLLLLVLVVFVIAFSFTAATISVSFWKFEGQTTTCSRQQFGHAVHSLSRPQRGSLQSIIGIAIVGASFQGGALKFLLESGRCRESIENRGSLHNHFGAWLEQFAAAFAGTCSIVAVATAVTARQ